MTRRDGRAIARENELRVLRALHRFGWLRTRDIALLVWQRWAANALTEGPNLRPREPTAAALRMAQRTLCRMRDSRQILKSQAPNGSTLYALAEAGARSLQAIGISAASGKDLLRQFSTTHFRHRCIANEIAIGGIVDGFRASTEREAAKGHWLGGKAGIAGKIPDVLLRDGTKLWWVEVERSRKNSRDYARLLEWLDSILVDITRSSRSALLGDNLNWSKVIFVCVPAFRGALCRDLVARGWQKNHLTTLLMFETSLYKFEDISFS